MVAEWEAGDFLMVAIVAFFVGIAVWLIVSALKDLFRRGDVSGGAKTLWLVLILLVPIIGAMTYIMMRPQGKRFDPDAEREASTEDRHLGGKPV